MGQSVIRLQQYLNLHGFPQDITGYFGPITRDNLGRYQYANHLLMSGIADDNFISKSSSSDKIDDWCLAIRAHEGFYAPGENPAYPSGTLAWRNNNPGNLVFRGQENARANGRFAKFNTYQDGYNALRNMLIWACTGQSRVYSPDDSLLTFFAKYAPDSDGNDSVGYAKAVARRIGVPVETPIKKLINQ